MGEPPEAILVPPETLLPEPILVQPDSILVPPESSLVALGSTLVPTESTTPPPKTILLPPLIFSAHTEGSFVLVFLRPERGVHGFLRPHHRNQNPKLGSENCFARAMMPANKSQKTSSRHENWYPKVIRNSVKQKKKSEKIVGTTAVGDAGY